MKLPSGRDTRLDYNIPRDIDVGQLKAGDKVKGLDGRTYKVYWHPAAKINVWTKILNKKEKEFEKFYRWQEKQIKQTLLRASISISFDGEKGYWLRRKKRKFRRKSKSRRKSRRKSTRKSRRKSRKSRRKSRKKSRKKSKSKRRSKRKSRKKSRK